MKVHKEVTVAFCHYAFHRYLAICLLMLQSDYGWICVDYRPFVGQYIRRPPALRAFIAHLQSIEVR